MHASHRFRILIAVVVGAVLLGACGGDGDTATDEPSPTEEATPVGAEDDDGAEAEDAADAEEAEDDDEDESLQGGEFADLANQGFISDARVTYEVSNEDGTVQTLVLSSDGEQTAWLMPDGRMISRADGTSIICDESGQQPQCFQMGGEGQAGPMAGQMPFMGLATAFQQGVDTFPGFTSTGRQEIAGRTARCGTFDASQFATGQQADAGEATLCLDDETGIMLKYEARDLEGAAGGIEAVEVGEPEASDFEPPAEPMRMNQGG